jgi:hypothetical protein
VVAADGLTPLNATTGMPLRSSAPTAAAPQPPPTSMMTGHSHHRHGDVGAFPCLFAWLAHQARIPAAMARRHYRSRQNSSHEGWRCLKAQYDDGGISGGTLERPALQSLLADIQSPGYPVAGPSNEGVGWVRDPRLKPVLSAMSHGGPTP